MRANACLMSSRRCRVRNSGVRISQLARGGGVCLVAVVPPAQKMLLLSRKTPWAPPFRSQRRRDQRASPAARDQGTGESAWADRRLCRWQQYPGAPGRSSRGSQSTWGHPTYPERQHASPAKGRSRLRAPARMTRCRRPRCQTVASPGAARRRWCCPVCPGR